MDAGIEIVENSCERKNGLGSLAKTGWQGGSGSVRGKRRFRLPGDGSIPCAKTSWGASRYSSKGGVGSLEVIELEVRVQWLSQFLKIVEHTSGADFRTRFQSLQPEEGGKNFWNGRS
jgi:hypothetical protein